MDSQLDEASPGSLGSDLRQDAHRLTDAAAGRLESEANNRKGVAANHARSLSSALGATAQHLGDDTPHWLRKAIEQGASTLEDLAQSIDQKDSAQLVADVSRIARDNPATFLAGCAALGFAASRIFRAGITSQPADADILPSQGNQTQDRSMFAYTDGGGAALPVDQIDVKTSL